MEVAHAAPALGAGRFEVRGTLGAGGAGVVYRAFDHQLGREVALKVLRQASGRDLFRFKREFRALADIVHPNLVALNELHAVGDEWYFTMELVEGVSFIDWVRPAHEFTGTGRTRQDIANTPVDDNRLRGALIQLVDALIALHKAGKLHRDLKPSNVLVTDEGRLALLDFGLVSGVAEDDPERLAVGTPVYMSPEQASDQPLSEASDWYSVGAMLYEALSGRRPFEGNSEQVMRRKQTELPPTPAQLVATTPADLSRLCMAMLQPAPSSRPDGLTILGQLGAMPSSATRDIARNQARGAFVGRTREIEQLGRAFTDARRRGVSVFVKARSGMGKSTLVRQFLRELGDGVFVLEGRCFERESVPFKMLDGVVDALTGAIVGLLPAEIETLVPRELSSMVRLFPVLRRVPLFNDLASQTPAPPDPQELRARGFAALRQVLTKLARIRPMVIYIDDVHWGDADSAVFLAELIYYPEPALLIILAHRPEDYLGVVALIRRPPGGNPRGAEIRDVELPPLSDADARQLVRELSSDDWRVEDVLPTAGGNPLILTEMARAHDLVAGTTIEQLVAARAARLSPDAQAMLVVSSVAAKPIPVEIAAIAAGVIGGHDEAAQLSAERLATLRRVGGQMMLQPAHDHVRIAVLGALDVEAKAAWHEALARAFEGTGAVGVDSQTVVEHWLAAGHPANAAAHAVPAAARAEEALAFRRAAELYQIALTYGPWDALGQRDLLRRQAHALTCAGALDEAAQIYGHAAQLVADEEAIDLERLRVEQLLRRNRLAEALPAAEALLGLVGMKLPLGSRASKTKLATQWMQMKFRGLDYVERAASAIAPAELRRIDVLYSLASGLAFTDPASGRLLQTEFLRAALDAGEPFRVCLALAQEVCYQAAGGPKAWPQVEVVGARLKAVAIRVGHPHVIGLADTSMGLAAYLTGRWKEARLYMEAGLATLRNYGTGVRWEVDVGEVYWLATLQQLGEWRELARLVPAMLRDATDRGDLVAQQGLRGGRSNFAWLLLGKPDEARAQLELAEAQAGDGFHLQHVYVLLARATLEVHLGQHDAAHKRLEAAWPQIDRLGALRLWVLRVDLLVLRARAILGNGARPVDERAKAARAIGEELIKEGGGWAIGVGQLIRAAAYALHDDAEPAHAALLAAEEQLVGADGAGWLQVARLRRGQLEGGAGGMARAEAARDQLRDLGALQPDATAQLLLPWPWR
jgi:tRNA A-37 threonylcarbamoyl transferase component Bud32/tetratricopeptide (TPR) repeat protein